MTNYKIIVHADVITKTAQLVDCSVLVTSKQPWWDSCALTREMLKTRKYSVVFSL